MPGPVHRFLAADHRALEALLERALADPRRIDPAAYEAFRSGLLRHIAMEEKVLLPAARAARGASPMPEAARLRLDHGAIAALLVPPPTAAIAATIRRILEGHDRLEEDPGGVYEACEALAGDGAAALLERLRAVPAPRVSAHQSGPRVDAGVRAALARAGHALED